LCGGGHEGVDHHVELQLAHGFIVAARVLGRAGQEVVGLAPQALDRVGGTGLHLF
jgi:hypothetical protein